jgi:hypothetical protein
MPILRKEGIDVTRDEESDLHKNCPADNPQNPTEMLGSEFHPYTRHSGVDLGVPAKQFENRLNVAKRLWITLSWFESMRGSHLRVKHLRDLG